ncbi:MAG: preQ(1) synthase [bacterium]|nr:preQ(1) synthase [bacterium]
MPLKPSKELKTFKNPHPDIDYKIEIYTEEFTCLCPMTSQPDFAKLKIIYYPDKLCVELKSLKAYFWSYRNEGAFHEDVTNKILKDLFNLLKPKYIEITAEFNIRGGIKTTVTVSKGKKPVE